MMPRWQETAPDHSGGMIAGGRNSGFVEEPLLASRGSARVVGEEEGRVSGEEPE